MKGATTMLAAPMVTAPKRSEEFLDLRRPARPGETQPQPFARARPQNEDQLRDAADAARPKPQHKRRWETNARPAASRSSPGSEQIRPRCRGPESLNRVQHGGELHRHQCQDQIGKGDARQTDTVSANCRGLSAKPGASTWMMAGMKIVASIRSTICAAICQANMPSANFAAAASSPRACSAA